MVAPELDEQFVEIAQLDLVNFDELFPLQQVEPSMAQQRGVCDKYRNAEEPYNAEIRSAETTGLHTAREEEKHVNVLHDTVPGQTPHKHADSIASFRGVPTGVTDK